MTKPGPKPKPASERVTQTVAFRVTSAEKRSIRDASRAAGHKRPGPWLREVAVKAAGGK